MQTVWTCKRETAYLFRVFFTRLFGPKLWIFDNRRTEVDIQMKSRRYRNKRESKMEISRHIMFLMQKEYWRNTTSPSFLWIPIGKKWKRYLHTSIWWTLQRGFERTNICSKASTRKLSKKITRTITSTMPSGPCELGLTSCSAVNTVLDPNI